MPGPNVLYQREMHDNLGFFPVWLPGDNIELGDVGVLVSGRFRKEGSLRELGIEQHLGPLGTARPVRYASTKGSKLDGTAGASARDVVKGSLKVLFSQEGAFLFHALGLLEQKLEERIALFSDIIESHKAGLWRKEWLLVESVCRAESVTILVSEDPSTELGLEASVELSAGANLADPHLGLKVSSRHGRTFEVIAASNIQPLYSCVRVEKSFWGQPRVRPARGAHNVAASESDPFSRAGIDELVGA